MAQELEFKLAIDPQAAAGFWPALRERLPGIRPARRALYSAYYDTPDGHLQRHGIALRLRRQGGQWLQTVKRGGEAAGGLHRRLEHEAPVAARLPSFPAMEDAGIGEVVAPVREALGVVFTTDFERTSALVRPGAGTVIEVALDRGAILADGRREPICEVELELKAGEPQALFDLARWIAQTLPVRLDDRSKAERGYRLAAGWRPAPAKAGDSALEPGLSTGEAMRRLGFQCLVHLQANEAGLLAGRNPEYLHQARVALRRLRSLLRMLRTPVPDPALSSLLERLRALARQLGAARNLDVFLGETLPRAGSASYPGMAKLRQRAVLARRAASREARAAASAPAYTGLMLDVLDYLARLDAATGPPVEAMAADLLGRLHRRARKRGRRVGTLGVAELHRLRIALKRLRYAMEFFKPLWPRAMPDALAALSDLQDALGGFNDAATAWKLLDALAVESHEAAYQQAVGYVRGWTAREAQRRRRELPAAWKRFIRLKPGWR
ncbi:MAG TPA: CHAD domain-containing protein [Burkholderiales bacterium]|nr:CHAD domain-containing protein [Burkholderiales bacterium]